MGLLVCQAPTPTSWSLCWGTSSAGRSFCESLRQTLCNGQDDEAPLEDQPSADSLLLVLHTHSLMSCSHSRCGLLLHPTRDYAWTVAEHVFLVVGWVSVFSEGNPLIRKFWLSLAITATG